MNRLFYFLFFLPLLSLTGCNSDIFVDEFSVGSDNIVLVGDGTNGNFRIKLSEIRDFRLLSDMPGGKLTYYDKDGQEVMAVSSFMNLKRINFSNNWLELNAVINNNRVNIECVNNICSKDVNFIIEIEYPSSTKEVNLKIEPGMPGEVIKYTPQWANRSCYDTFTDYVNIYLENSGTEPVTYDLRKYICVQKYAGTAEFMLDNSQFGYNLNCSQPLPFPGLVNGEWKEEIYKEAVPGFDTVIPLQPNNKAFGDIPFTVQAGESANLSVYLTYSLLKIPFTVTASRVNSEKVSDINGTLVMTVPTSYKITSI